MDNKISRFSKLKSLMLVLVLSLSFLLAGTVLLNVNTYKKIHNLNEIESVEAYTGDSTGFSYSKYNI